jgi:hypothetical protein
MVKGQKYHILYKTTCTVTGNFYIGVHSTKNLEDGYLGSGTRLSNSIKKHGKENHVREILQLFENRGDLMKKEREIVNPELLNEEKCMNLKRGGEGGLHLVDKEAQKRIHEGATKWLNEKWKDPNFRKDRIKEISENMKKRHEMGIVKYDVFTGKSHTEETKSKIGIGNSKSQLGEKNSQYGTRWITDGLTNRKISKNDQIPEGWSYGRF